MAGKSAKMGIAQKFLSPILMSLRAHRYPIFQRLSRIILKYSDFNFYAATKNDKFDFEPYLELVKYISIQLSESFNFLRACFLSLNKSFWTDGIFQNTRWAKIGWGVQIFDRFAGHKKNSHLKKKNFIPFFRIGFKKLECGLQEFSSV